MTELPGLDDLSCASGILARLQERCAASWNAAASFISVNGASAALLAAILACANRGQKLLVPRNSHRSVIHALVLSGLEPVWYEPDWMESWQVYGAAQANALKETLREPGLAGALVVSPTFAGVLSDIKGLSQACRSAGIPLIVDEAHGTHLIPGCQPPSALSCGADLVAHSTHKTLPALTQTGIVHVGHDSLVPPQAVHSALNLVHTSSPSYLLLSSLEAALDCLPDSPTWLSNAQSLRKRLELLAQRHAGLHLLQAGLCDPLHITLRVEGVDATELFDHFCRQGVFPEAILGRGVLFLLGAGTRSEDTEAMLAALEALLSRGTIGSAGWSDLSKAACANKKEVRKDESRPIEFGEQVLSPRRAFLSECEIIPLAQAEGRVAAECVAPCPPGTPVIVPGQRVTAEAVLLCKQTQLRVVVESR